MGMGWQEIDRMLHRAFSYCLSKRKFLFTFSILSLSSCFVSGFRALSEGSGEWVHLSFAFLPVFVVATMLMATGIVLIRAYHHEIKKISFSFRDLTKKSWDLMISVSYLTLPLSMAYITLWSVVGFFYVLKEIPVVGDVMSVLLCFVPFLLVFTFILLAVANACALFFLPPVIALRSECCWEIFMDRFVEIKARALTYSALFLIALVPISLVLGFLFLASYITGSEPISPPLSLSQFIQSLITSIAFSALCTPSVIFFFNFSAESYIWMKKSSQVSIS
jgi:hypothetical protein